MVYGIMHFSDFSGCPLVVRADYGTENCGVAKVQIAFRMGHDDSLSQSGSFIYGPSTANIVSNAQNSVSYIVLLCRLLSLIENRSTVVTVATLGLQLVDRFMQGMKA